MEAITTAIQASASEIYTNAVAMIGTVLPYALGIMGAVIVITIGIRVFRRVTGR